jgi:hypothetical protein
MSEIEPFWSHGVASCPVCQSPLSIEEIDFECCDCCGGESMFAEEDFDPRNFQQ